MLIAPFFRSNADINVDFYKSEDGINFDKIGTPFKGRDGSLIYYNNQYLVLTTDYVPNDYDMAVMSSNDFKTWKWNAVRCGLCTTNNNKIWASEWFLDGDKLYIITSVRQPKDEKDIDGRIIPNFRPYIIPAESTNPIKLGTPRMLNLENANKIDGQIIKHNCVYYMFIKNEYNKNTEMWTSKDLVSWKKERNYIVHDGERIEGVCCVKYDDKFYLYGDKFQSGKGIHYSVSNDLKTFSKWKPINTDGNKTRHGSVCRISNEKALKTMGISVKPVQKEDKDMIDKIVVYFGDVDLLGGAILMSQKLKCPLMRLSDYEASGIKAKEVIQIGGNPEDKNRYDTLKNTAKIL